MSAADDVEAKLEKVNRRKTSQRISDERIRKTVVRALMSAPDGRRYVWLELSSSNVFAQTYCEGSFDRTAFSEGVRTSGLRLLADVQRFAIADFVRMLQENNAKIEELEDVRSPDSLD